jgi:hypothetical protein
VIHIAAIAMNSDTPRKTHCSVSCRGGDQAGTRRPGLHPRVRGTCQPGGHPCRADLERTRRRGYERRDDRSRRSHGRSRRNRCSRRRARDASRPVPDSRRVLETHVRLLPEHQPADARPAGAGPFPHLLHRRARRVADCLGRRRRHVHRDRDPRHSGHAERVPLRRPSAINRAHRGFVHIERILVEETATDSEVDALVRTFLKRCARISRPYSTPTRMAVGHSETAGSGPPTEGPGPACAARSAGPAIDEGAVPPADTSPAA